jgi:hypothetical protein
MRLACSSDVCHEDEARLIYMRMEIYISGRGKAEDENEDEDEDRDGLMLASAA